MDSLAMRNPLYSVSRESYGNHSVGASVSEEGHVGISDPGIEPEPSGRAVVGSYTLWRGRMVYEQARDTPMSPRQAGTQRGAAQLSKMPLGMGNVLAVVSDVKIGVSPVNTLPSLIDYYTADPSSSLPDFIGTGRADVVEMSDYEPAPDPRIGWILLAKRHWVSGNAYDFGARIFDSRLGRWLAVDPLSEEYIGYSPFNFALCTPLQAVDPDGKLVIFVNGFRKGAYEKYLKKHARFVVLPWWPVIPKAPWESRPLYSRTDIFGSEDGSYWKLVDDYFMERHADPNSIYVDGGYKPHSTAQERYNRGLSDGLSIIQRIRSGEIELKAGETIKIAGHSHGGWHAVGMADALAANGYDVEVLYAKNPHNPDQHVKRISQPFEGRFVQYSSRSDLVSSDDGRSAPQERLAPDWAGWGLRRIADGLVSDSKFAKMQGVNEMVELSRLDEDALGGHDVYQNIDYIGKIEKGKDGYVGSQN